MPLVPPSQPTQAPECVDITGRSAVTRPPGDSSQPCSPCWTGSRLATATTGRASVAVDADSLIAVTVAREGSFGTLAAQHPVRQPIPQGSQQFGRPVVDCGR